MIVFNRQFFYYINQNNLLINNYKVLKKKNTTELFCEGNKKTNKNCKYKNIKSSRKDLRIILTLFSLKKKSCEGLIWSLIKLNKTMFSYISFILVSFFFQFYFSYSSVKFNFFIRINLKVGFFKFWV